MTFKLPDNKEIQKIPRLYREAFESLRERSSDPIGLTWAITLLTDDSGKSIPAIVQMSYDPETKQPLGYTPIFIAYPHTEEEVKRYETIPENYSELVN